MIAVTYYRERDLLTVKGHAKSADYGKDLICAAVSALALTLGGNVEYMADSGCVTEPVVRLEEGDAQISCKPLSRFRAVVRQTFLSVCVGFELLAKKYPEYISFTFLG